MPEPVTFTPKERFTSLDTLAVVRELRLLSRARVDKAFDLVSGGFSLTVRSASAGRRELLLIPGVYAALIDDPGPHAEGLTPMSRELRRLLSGAVIRSVREPGGERYLELEFDRSDSGGSLLLATELFGAGNLLVARGEKIVATLHSKTWAHRSVRVGAAYSPPPARTNPWTLSTSELEAELSRSRTDRASTLAARLAFGGPLAEELLTRASVSGGEPASRDPEETAGKLHRALNELLGDVGDQPKGFLYESQGTAVDVAPFPSHRWRAEPGITESVVDNFSKAAHNYFAALAPPPAKDRGKGDLTAELRRQRERQSAAVIALEAEAAEMKAQAETIFSHYSEAEEQLESAEGNGAGDGDVVELRLEGRRIRLPRGVSLSEGVQGLYDQAKRAQSKLAGARAAFADTEARLTAIAVEERAQTVTSSSLPSTTRARKPHWFERFRWFLSSEGVLVIGGRDAASNDLIVRRYLHEGDFYLHADIHGAPSVIVRHPEPGEPSPTEATLTEAGQWGVAFSKAWRAGLASGSAFWVTKDQVSKAGSSGEFVPKGAWVIHGTKHFLRDLPTELAIGTITFQSEELWTVAPPTAIRARGTIRFLMTPGPERERAEREVELAKELGLPRSRLQGMLPAGGLTLRRA